MKNTFTFYTSFVKHLIPGLLALAICGIALPVSADTTVCPRGTMTKDVLAQLQERRERTFKHCLACEGNRCQLKPWPADENSQKLAHMCKTFFCTPVSMPRSTFTPEAREMEGTLQFTYEINEKGRADNFQITTVSGDVKEEEAVDWARSLFKRRKYEPIEIDGTTYVITNLRSGTRVRGQFELR